MRKLSLYSAVSLNGKIARPDGKVDWLDEVDHPKGEDYGYGQFYEGIDTTIMGHNTYKEVLGFGVEFPYKGKENYVFTRNTSKKEDQHVRFVSDDLVDFVQQLKKTEGRGMWLVGGGRLNTAFLNADLIDEMILHVMPIIIPDGIDLFQGEPNEAMLKLINSKIYSSGVVELHYNRK